MTRSAAVLLLILLLAGCASGTPSPPPVRSAAGTATQGPTAGDAATPIPAGRSTRSIEVDGATREVRLYRPARLTSPPALVVVLHGGGGSAATAEAAYGWDRDADANGFVVAYPESEHNSWNAGSCCAVASAQKTDDVGFVVGATGQLARALGVDPARTYLTGFSNGAMLTLRIACETDGVFAAVAPVSGTQLVPCTGAKPVSMLAIHGTADPNVPYAGGPGSGVGGVDGPSALAINQSWRGIDGCSAPTETTVGAITRSIASCPQERTVELVTITGGGHHWPGSPTSSRDPSNAADNSFDATAQIWTFFDAHAR